MPNTYICKIYKCRRVGTRHLDRGIKPDLIKLHRNITIFEVENLINKKITFLDSLPWIFLVQIVNMMIDYFLYSRKYC